MFTLIIYVDADACPVTDIIIQVAEAHSLKVRLVKSFDHYSLKENPHFVEAIYVDKGADAADYKIMQLAQPGDLIITQDYGLASLALAKGCLVMHHKGFSYRHDNIDMLLHSRYESALARKSGKRTKGPKALTPHDKEVFKQKLQKVLEEANR